jgi:membrane peptidoglycan carboxypeptidase
MRERANGRMVKRPTLPANPRFSVSPNPKLHFAHSPIRSIAIRLSPIRKRPTPDTAPPLLLGGDSTQRKEIMVAWIKRHAKALGIGAFAVLALLFVLYQRCGISGCPDVDKLNGYMPDEASSIVDYRGEEIGKLFITRRTVVPLDTLPELVPAAFVAMEDRRFYDHNGVDWRRVIGAAYKNVKSLGIEEGSSTITMQLARNVFPEKLPANRKTVFRKLAEARVARSIEGKFSKEEILELYLNQIYFGQGAYGIEAAAQEYYGKSAARLTLPEAATLAALPRAPSRRSPHCPVHHRD